MSGQQIADLKPFDVFLRQLKSRKADPVLRYIRSFTQNFLSANNPIVLSAQQQQSIVQEFAAFITLQLHSHEPFSVLNEREFANAVQGVEKLVMTKLYDLCYSPAIASIDESHKEDITVDSLLDCNFQKFTDLTPKDLDVDPLLVDRGAHFIQLAAQELNKLSEYRAPKAKVVCLLNACKVLFQLIQKSEQNTNADEFLPLLVWTVHHGKVRHLYSNLKYIERFAFEAGSEAEYYLVSLSAAVEYLKGLGQRDVDEQNLIEV